MIQCEKLAALGLGSTKDKQSGNTMSIKVSEVDAQGFTKFCISYMGITWFATQEFEQVQYLADHLARTYPSLSAFTRRDSLMPAFMDP